MDDARRDAGFTLLELMVTVIVLGVLAAIAIPSYLDQRQRAWRSSAMSDLRNAVVQIEDAAASGTTYPSMDPSTITGSGDTTFRWASVSATAYCLEVDHARLDGAADFHFDSTEARSSSGGC